MKSLLPVTLCAALALFAGCAKDNGPKEASPDELKKRAFAYINKEKYEQACEMIEEIVSKHSDHKHINKFKLLLADTYFKATNYVSATNMYDHFNQHYPADKKAEYAKYRAILSQYYRTLKIDCDQTSTKTTVHFCKTYLDNKNYNRYRRDVEDIQNTCEHKLLNKEIYVFNFYLKQKNYDAAKNRLDSIQKLYVEKKKSLQPRILYLHCKLAQAQKQETTIKKNLDELFTRYPESQYARMAQALTTKRDFVF